MATPIRRGGKVTVSSPKAKARKAAIARGKAKRADAERASQKRRTKTAVSAKRTPASEGRVSRIKRADRLRGGAGLRDPGFSRIVGRLSAVAKRRRNRIRRQRGKVS